MTEEDLTLFEYEEVNGREEITAEEPASERVTRHKERPKDPHFFKGCPECKTDSYLMDLQPTKQKV